MTEYMNTTDYRESVRFTNGSVLVEDPTEDRELRSFFKEAEERVMKEREPSPLGCGFRSETPLINGERFRDLVNPEKQTVYIVSTQEVADYLNAMRTTNAHFVSVDELKNAREG
jgi:hypothetical protein